MGSESSDDESITIAWASGASPLPLASITCIAPTSGSGPLSVPDMRAAEGCVRQSTISAHKKRQAETSRAGRESFGT